MVYKPIQDKYEGEIEKTKETRMRIMLSTFLPQICRIFTVEPVQKLAQSSVQYRFKLLTTKRFLGIITVQLHGD